MAENGIQSTTQQYLDIYDIINDLVIMKDGTTSLILSVDAMNFGLLAEEEQDSIIYAYAGLLNSLNYPIQVIVKSQTKDVTSYLRLLQEQESTAESPENRQRIRRYREFVSNLIHERNVLDKKFYVIIPASPLELGLLSAESIIPGKQTFDVSSVEKTVLLDKARNLLEPKRDHLISQFSRIGLNSRQLTTQEIIQYFYVSYNPEASEGQEIADSNSYSTPMVKASFEGFAMPQNNQADQNQPNQQTPQQLPGQDGVAQPPQPNTAPPQQVQQTPPAAESMPPVQNQPLAPQEQPQQLPNQPLPQQTSPQAQPIQQPVSPPAQPQQQVPTVPEVEAQASTKPPTQTQMPPGPSIPNEEQNNQNIPVENQTIQKPQVEVTLPPNQDQQVGASTPTNNQDNKQQPDVEQGAEQNVVQEEINQTLNQLGTENQAQPVQQPVSPPAQPQQQGDQPITNNENESPPPIPEIN